MKINENFHIDMEVSQEDQERLFVEVPGLGYVVLIRNMDGLSVDVWSETPTVNPIFTGYCLNEDFMMDDEPEVIADAVVEWKRTGWKVGIQKFSLSMISNLVADWDGETRTSFSSYVVRKSIMNFKELHSRMEDINLLDRVAPPLIMHELYELCAKVNPTFIYDNFNKDDLEDKSWEEVKNKNLS